MAMAYEMKFSKEQLDAIEAAVRSTLSASIFDSWDTVTKRVLRLLSTPRTGLLSIPRTMTGVDGAQVREATLIEAKAGWDSCIADLREAGEILRRTEVELTEARAERDALKAELQRFKAPFSDEEVEAMAQKISCRPWEVRRYGNALIAARAAREPR
jgi:hypothetical protein